MKESRMERNFTIDMKWWEKVMYYLLFSIVYVVSLLPLRVLYVLSDAAYIILYHVVGYRLSLVRRSLRDSFPTKSDEELLTTERRFYHFFCDYIFETIKLASISKEEMRRRVKFTGLEHIYNGIDEGHNVALYLGHYCNWEWVTSVGLHLPEEALGCQVYHILENKVFNALMLTIRSNMGTESISMQNILRRIVTERRSGRKMVIGFISDQIPTFPNTHHSMRFLNHDNTLVITGTERISKTCNFVCVYFDISRKARGYYNVDIVPMNDKPHECADWELTEQYFHLLEKSIERDPSLWLWTHNRWKRDIEGWREWRVLYGKESVAAVNLDIPSTVDTSTRITVVTVAYNAKEALQTTMQSIHEQDYPNIEYIIIDGGSTDGTADMLSSYTGRLDRWVSEPDRGIYDAMNKGVHYATGDYCIFMNAGDTFMSPTTVSRVVRSGMSADVVYGFVMKDGKVKKALSPRNCHKMYYCHQCAFTRTQSLRDYPFDIRHSMSADFKQSKQLLLAGRTFRMLPYAIAVFDTSGISNRQRSKGLWDNITVICEVDTFIYKCRLLPRLFFTYLLCKLRGK